MYLSWEIKKVLPSNQNSDVFLRKKTGKIAGERNKKIEKNLQPGAHRRRRRCNSTPVSTTSKLKGIFTACSEPQPGLLLSSQSWSKGSRQEPSTFHTMAVATVVSGNIPHF